MTKITIAKKKITPSGEFFPCYLMGHAIRTQMAVGIQDDLYTTALFLQVDNQQFLWIMIELIGMDRPVSEKLYAQLSAEFGIPVENISLGFCHSHSAPEYSEVSLMDGKSHAVPGYMDFVIKQVKAAVTEAWQAGFTEVEVLYQRTEIEGFYSNRNGLDKTADKEILCLRFVAKGQTLASILNFACHSTVLGPQNLLVSPDLSGWLCRKMEETYGGVAMSMIGAAGDMSNRLYRQGNDQKELERTGAGIFAQLADNALWQPLVLTDPKVSTFHYHHVFAVDASRFEGLVAEIQNKIDTAESFDIKKTYTSALSFAKMLAQNPPREYELDIVSRYYQFGQLSVFTMPCELFACFGLMIKAAMSGTARLFWGYNTYSVGYLFDKADASKSFESAVSLMPAGTSEEVVSEIVRFLKEQNQS